MTRLIAPALLVLTLGVAKCGYDHQVAQRAVLAERLRASDSTVRELTRRAAKVETVYQQQVVRLTRRLVHWDTVRAGVDTLRDTVRVPVEVVRWITATADSTIRECRIVQQTCEQRVAQRDSLLALRDRQVQLLRSNQPSKVTPWLERAGWVAAILVLRR
jgi:hypothetical protein